MSRAVGLGKGSLKANQRGSVCPWGEMMGRSLTVSYSLAATERASPLAGNNLFASRIFIQSSQSSVARRNASIGRVSKISSHPEQMLLRQGNSRLGGCEAVKRYWPDERSHPANLFR